MIFMISIYASMLSKQTRFNELYALLIVKFTFISLRVVILFMFILKLHQLTTLNMLLYRGLWSDV